jgi:predicted metalloendopeptidase
MLAMLAACEHTPDAPPPVAPPPPPPPSAPPGPRVVEASLESVGLDEAALDRSVDPCTDFYQFACGNWIAKTQIPADKALWARSFSVIGDHNETVLHQILDEVASGKGDTADDKRLAAYYGACMDESGIEAKSAKPLEPILAIVKKVKDEKTLSHAIMELHARQVWALFDVSDTQDAKDATQVIAEIDQNGLGLPDRDYYVKDDDKSKEIREKYREHVARMFEILEMLGSGRHAAPKPTLAPAAAGSCERSCPAGAPRDEQGCCKVVAAAPPPKPTAVEAAADVMRIETELAQASKTRVERREPTTMYNRLDRSGVLTTAPKFLWDEYWKGLGYPEIQAITVTAPAFLAKVNTLLTSEKAPAWRNYLTWHVVRSLAPALPKAFVDEAFRFESTLTGQKEQRVRWKRCVSATDGAIGELLAQPFVKAYFTPESKEATERYVHEIAAAFGEELAKLDWMDPETKARAAEKLKAVAYLIGYPKKWKSYDFAIKKDNYLENTIAARTWRLKFNLSKVGKPLDREEWHMTPPTVNAYYSAQKNHMVFPAGILQPPFFNPKASIPVNLGGMGMVVGHELTHGFDDKGAKFDAKGNLSNWWTDGDKSRFKTKTECIADQYDHYEPLPGVKLNGHLTNGENIADAGGVKLAFRAYRAMRKDAAEVVKAGGFNEDQQFFLGVGQAWCAKLSDEVARLRAQVDPHSHPRFRVNGPLSNSPDFATAFSCADGTVMRRANACSVW